MEIKILSIDKLLQHIWLQNAKLGYTETANEIEKKYRFKNEKLIDKLWGMI